MANQWNLAVQGLLQGLSGLGQGYLQGRSKKDAYSGYKQGLNALYDQKQELLDIAKNEVIGNNGIETRQDPYANVQQGSNQGAFLQGKEMNNLYEPQQNQFMDILGKLYSHPYGEGYAKTLSGLYKGMNETPEYQYIETPNGIERINKKTGETKTIKEYPKEIKPEKRKGLSDYTKSEFQSLQLEDLENFTPTELYKHLYDFSPEIRDKLLEQFPEWKEEEKTKVGRTGRRSGVKIPKLQPKGVDKEGNNLLQDYLKKSDDYDKLRDKDPNLMAELEDMREGLKKYGLSDSDIDNALNTFRGGKDVDFMDLLGNEEETQPEENTINTEKQYIDEYLNDLISTLKSNPQAWAGTDPNALVQQIINDYKNAGYSGESLQYLGNQISNYLNQLISMFSQ